MLRRVLSAALASVLMALPARCVRRIIGSVTSGFSDESAVVRDEDNKLSGRTSERYDTTRDDHGNLVSINSADPGLLLGKRK
ncbi:MAG: hypothetical protein ABR881_21425 [Candidatus Sulfotelmatobacter sp.]